MEHYLKRSESLDVEIEELECYLLGPNELDVDITYLALHEENSSKGFLTRLVSKEQATSL